MANTIYEFLGLPQEQWQLINSFAEWFSAVGTVAAVIVSLYLARQDQRVRLRITATIGNIFGDPTVDVKVDHLWITVTNVGRRTAVLNSVAWRVGFLPAKLSRFGRKYAIQNFDLPNCTRLPAKLEDGDSASFMIPLDRWLGYFAGDMFPRPHWLSLYFVTALAFASTGKAASVRVSGSLRKALKEALRKAPG